MCQLYKDDLKKRMPSYPKTNFISCEIRKEEPSTSGASSEGGS